MKTTLPLIRLLTNRCYRPALMVLALAALLASPPARAALYLTEPFNYPAGALGVSPANGTWDTTAKSAINVTATNLTGPAGFPAASGNDITIGNSGHDQQNFSTFTSSGTIVSGTVYACFLLKVTSTGSMRSSDTVTSPNYNDGFTLALQNAASSASPFCSIRMINSSGCKIGLAKNGGTGTYRTAAISVNTNYMVVVKYDFSTTPNTASFWILSTYQSTEAGAAADVIINTGTDLAPGEAGLGKCYLSDAAGGTFQVDELRIGSTWQDVTGGAPAGSAAKLAFTTQPANAAPGATISAVVVQAQDAGGQAAATNNVPITLTLTGGSGTLGGTLTQNTDATGKATFSNLSIDLAGAGKQLTAAASGIGAGLTNAVSSTFSIVAPAVATKLAFTTQPVDAAVNAAMANVVVQIQDASSVNVASNNVPITLTLTAGTGILGGTTTVNSDATGKATFSTLTVDTAGTGKQLTAAASGIGAGLTSAASTTFVITNAGGGGVGSPGLNIAQTRMLPTGYEVAGTNGTPTIFAQIVGSPSLSLPQSNWLLVAYGNLDGSGNITFTNPVSPALPLAYYRLRTGNTVTKLEPPSILLPPQSQIVSPGATATFTVGAAGPLLQYLWFFNNAPIKNATNSSLVIPNAQAINIGNYQVIVANPGGSATSPNATLGVANVGPTITAHPVDQSVSAGGTAPFTVSATGTIPLTYTWYFNTNTPVPGGTNATLLMTSVTTNNAGKYACTVANGYGSAGSSNANLSISPVPTGTPNTNVLGWAAYTGVTGGALDGATASITCSNYVSFSNAVRQLTPLTIYVQGTITNSENYCYIYGPNKSIIGLGTNAAFIGDLRVNATNVIIRNLYFTGTVPNSDLITIDGGSKGTGKYVWVDHCTFYDAVDGAVDITKGADYVTVSWCKFTYAYAPPGTTSHEYVNLIGSSDSDTNVNFHVTFHHNWWSDGCRERMPSVRAGHVHVFNNYYDCIHNNYCVRTRLHAELLVENNYFLNVQNPWERFTSSEPGAPGLLKATGNITNNCTWSSTWVAGVTLIPGTDTLGSDLNPPLYTYPLDPAADVPYYIQTYCGSGKYPFGP